MACIRDVFMACNLANTFMMMFPFLLTSTQLRTLQGNMLNPEEKNFHLRLECLGEPRTF
jgi:hypothetical protein